MCGPFFTVALQHTNEAQFQKGPRTFNMQRSYDVALLNQLAEYMGYLFTASSFKYSLASSYDHEFCISKRLGMSPQAFEYLLVAAQLAHFHKKMGLLHQEIEVGTLH